MSDKEGYVVTMCRYLYGDGKCAHPKNIAVKCIGEKNCQYREENLEDDFMFEQESDDGCQGEEDNMCPNTKCGVYCQKFGRFYCPGEENCKTEDDYFEQLNMHGGRMEE